MNFRANAKNYPQIKPMIPIRKKSVKIDKIHESILRTEAQKNQGCGDSRDPSHSSGGRPSPPNPSW
jgi:hypothetical protein